MTDREMLERDREAHERYVKRCYEEDIAARVDEMISCGDLPEDCTVPTAEQFERALGKCDAYFDAYWSVMDYVIKEANK